MTFIRFADRPTFRNAWAEFERIRQGLHEISRSYTEKGQSWAGPTSIRRSTSTRSQTDW